jgi:hypothetical protein
MSRQQGFLSESPFLDYFGQNSVTEALESRPDLMANRVWKDMKIIGNKHTVLRSITYSLLKVVK